MKILDAHEVGVVQLVDQLSRDANFIALMEHFTNKVIPQLTRELVLSPGGDARDWASGRIATLVEITEAVRQYRESKRNPPKPGASKQWP